MGNRPHFAPGEWYHCYSRGVDKRDVFETERDYERFTELLYLANSIEPMPRDSNKLSHNDIFEQAKRSSLVSIGAYALMSNHFHLLLYETDAGGISSFMRKLGIGYAMYFNTKYDRVGNLFVKPFRSQHVSYDEYLQHCVDYIHLNPAEILINGYKQGTAEMSSLRFRIQNYKYSSLMDFLGRKRPENIIIGKEIFDVYQEKSLDEMLSNTLSYYAESNHLQR